MLANKTSKNHVALPKKALQEIPETDYFEVTSKDGVLILRPVTLGEPGSRLAAVHRKIKDLGIEPKDVDRAIAWARRRRRSSLLRRNHDGQLMTFSSFDMSYAERTLTRNAHQECLGAAENLTRACAIPSIMLGYDSIA